MNKTTNHKSRGLIWGFMMLAWIGVNASAPSGYYNSLEGLSGVSLKKAVKSVARNHTAISYGSGSWEVFLESDTRFVNGQRCWWDMYSSDNVPAPSSSSHSGMNIEHGVANSWWGKTQNDAYKDLFHLNPSNSDANSRKSNYPLGEVGKQTWSNGVTFIGTPANGTGDDASYVYEPADEYKGDFARAFFYMFTIYDDIGWVSQWDWMYDTSSSLLLKRWAYEMLLRWSKEDPVSQKEIDRNEVIYKHQKNRNPFIDHPELAEHIWGSKSGQPFHADGSVDPGDSEDPDPGVTPTPGEDNGFWYAVTSASDLNEKDKYILVSVDNHVVMTCTTGGNANVTYFQPCAKAAEFDFSQTPARISGVPENAAYLTLSKSGSGWIIQVADEANNLKGYIISNEVKKVDLTLNASQEGTVARITPSASQTSIVYTGSDKLQYNNQENGKRFTSYSSTQEAVMLYRLSGSTQEEEKPDAGLGTGTFYNADEIVTGIFDINGRRMNVDSLRDLMPGIYIVVSNFGVKKILI